MPLETGNKISDLNPLWPLGSDPKAQGDDHLRLIKEILTADAPSLAEGGSFAVHPEVPDGATGLQAVNAQTVPLLAGTGPVDIVEDDVAAGWTVWGSTLLQWGLATAGSANSTVTFPQAFETVPVVVTAVGQGASGTNSASHTVVDGTLTTTGFTSRARSGSTTTGSPRYWAAVGQAPAALIKPTTVQTIGGSELQEFHDPAGIDSWRIVGSTLEVWGSGSWTVSTTSGDRTTPIPFAKTFMRPPTLTLNIAEQTADGVAPRAVTVRRSNTTETEWSFEAKRGDNGSAISPVRIEYHAIGEWDGVS